MRVRILFFRQITREKSIAKRRNRIARQVSNWLELFLST